jgi:mono/diheme cytochrome c family protein
MQRWVRSPYGSYTLFVGGLVLLMIAVGFLPNWSDFAAEAREETGTFWKSDLQARGERLYVQNCATCHGGRGEGMEEIFPPLDGSQVVNGVDAWSVMLVMHGRGAMPGFNHILDDDEIAAVLSFTRTSWGNRAGPISPELVRKIRVDAFEPLH